MTESTTGTFEGVFGTEILNALDPERMYPRWEKRWSSYHYEKSECDCGCECCCEDERVPDKDAVEYDVWVPYAPTLWGLLPKVPWNQSGWNKTEVKQIEK